ncbi:hypothetical protein RB195_018532 [Necator americanus]|uniref:Reverse transcriptase domain-containing protein n=1 Tax=Necator americanus TaxID=51031 RepID=A0ABR1CC44_NECAM
MDRLIRHHEETIRDEEAGFRPDRSTVDQPLSTLLAEAVFNVLRTDGVLGKFVCLVNDMNRTAAVQTLAGTTPFEVETGVRQGCVAGLFLFNFAVDDIMRRIVEQCPTDVILAPSTRPLLDLEYADASSSAMLQRVVNLVSKLVAP